MKTLSLEAGILLIPAIKDAVSKCKFMGYNIDAYYGLGWFSKNVILKGDDECIDKISQWLEDIR